LLFESYRFDNLETDETIFVQEWSYFWAAIGGPIYLLARRHFRRAALMTAISALLLVAVASGLSLVVGLFDDIAISIVCGITLPVIAMAAQSVIAVQLERAALISQGWRGGY